MSLRWPQKEPASWLPPPGSFFRTFLALPLGADVSDALARTMDAWRPILGKDVRWVAREHLHISLAFLGDSDAERLGRLDARLAAEVPEQEPFDLEVAGIGFFGPARHPRVLWAGVSPPSAALACLQANVARHAAACGWAPEARPFHPHVTLGRFRSHRAVTAEDPWPSDRAFGRWPVNALHLVRSRLHPRGPVYECLRRYCFRVRD